MKKILFIAVLGVFILLASGLTSFAGVWQEKPVMCGNEQEVFGLMGEKDEQLLFTGNVIIKVRDPDEANGLSTTPAILPLAVYVNLDTRTFSIVERHGDPYNTYCILGFGQEFTFPDYGVTK